MELKNTEFTKDLEEMLRQNEDLEKNIKKMILEDKFGTEMYDFLKIKPFYKFKKTKKTLKSRKARKTTKAIRKRNK